MDPLTVLGLASNIIQLISFTTDLVSKGREIYNSADGGLMENRDLETIAESLQRLSNGLSISSADEASMSSSDMQLRGICNSCTDVSMELISAISKLKARGSNKKWNSFRQALNSILEKETIDSLSKRMERYRRHLDTTLLVSLREQLQENSPNRRLSEDFEINEDRLWKTELLATLKQSNWQSKSQQDMLAFSSKLSACSKDDRDRQCKAHIMEQLSFAEMGDRFERIEEEHRRTFDWMFEESRHVTTTSSANQDSSLDVPKYRPRLADDEAGHENSAAQSGEPSSLGISHQAPESGAQVTEAARASDKTKTIHWNSFVDWLKGDEGLYWITGKPGSGKSTLVKYLYNHHQTRNYLTQWSGEKPFSISGFFFWNSGAVMQMSRIGLLQALLHECTKETLDLIPILFPARWRSFQLFGGDTRHWTWSELSLAFQTLLSNKLRNFFFFIDGLDEFDGDCTEMVEFVLKYSAEPNVKICVASRPWLVFEDAFQQRPSLRLEDLTAPDMVLFSKEKLRGHDMFTQLESRHPQEAMNLIEEITAKASGVFLWVRLVIVSLLEGLRDGDSLKDLQKRLHALPAELEDLFSKILNQLNISYFEEASKFFQLVRASLEPLSLLTLSFAENDLDDAMVAKIEPMPLAEVEYRIERMRRQLSSRCKGLLEAPPLELQSSPPDQEGPQSTVQYLHRTVKDFLNRPDIWQYILSGTTESFNPRVSLSIAFLMRMKALSLPTDGERSSLEEESDWHEFRKQLTNVSQYTMMFENEDREMHLRIIQELHRTLNILFGKYSSTRDAWRKAFLINRGQDAPFLTCWAERSCYMLDGNYQPIYLRLGLPSHARPISSFFDYALQYPFYSFIEYALKYGHEIDDVPEAGSLLIQAVTVQDDKMIEILLLNGADPNHSKAEPTGAGWTPWKELLSELRRSPKARSDDYNIEAKVVLMFLEHGADTGAFVNHQSVSTVIKNRYEYWDPASEDQVLQKQKLMITADSLEGKSQKGLKRLSKIFKGLGRSRKESKGT